MLPAILHQLIQKQQLRQAILKKEFTRVVDVIHKNGWNIFPVKGAATGKLYQAPHLRVHLDHDFVASSCSDAFALGSWLLQDGYHLLADGAVPFSIKKLKNEHGGSYLTGHFHLEKILYGKYQMIIDVNFPGFPLGRVGIFPLSDSSQTSWEEHFVVALCHVFKHDVVYMKDINDIWRMLQYTNINIDTLETLIDKYRLNFFYHLLCAYIRYAFENSYRPSQSCPWRIKIIIFFLQRCQWPYSRVAHFWAKAFDLMQRSSHSGSLLSAIGGLLQHCTGTLTAAETETTKINRLYLSPLLLFKHYVTVPIEKKNDRFEVIEKNSLILSHAYDTSIAITPMGIFLASLESQGRADKKLVQCHVEQLLIMLNLGPADILPGGIQESRKDLWLF